MNGRGSGSAAVAAGPRMEAALRSELRARLEARRGEIEQALLTRTHAIADPAETLDPEYAEGLAAALDAALEHAFAVVESAENRPLPIPPLLLSQARLAARRAVTLDIVLRRYFTGFTLFGDFVLQEARRHGSAGGSVVHGLLQSQAVHFDSLIYAVSEEYTREREAWLRAPERRQAECVDRLLAGEAVETDELAYGLDAWHLGLAATGAGLVEPMRKLAKATDRRLLLVPSSASVWVWLGGKDKLDPEAIARLAREHLGPGVALAIGEPGSQVAGWRLTHRQAKAALPIAVRSGDRSLRYASVALLASMRNDDLLVASLTKLYLEPLSGRPPVEAALRATLRAYFAADRNISSTAAALGVKRHTVTNRLRTVEERIGQPIKTAAAAIEVALRLEELGVG